MKKKTQLADVEQAIVYTLSCFIHFGASPAIPGNCFPTSGELQVIDCREWGSLKQTATG